MHGYGRAIYKNGTYYIGDFKEGKKHGNGRLTNENGNVKQGRFENGKFISWYYINIIFNSNKNYKPEYNILTEIKIIR